VFLWSASDYKRDGFEDPVVHEPVPLPAVGPGPKCFTIYTGAHYPDAMQDLSTQAKPTLTPYIDGVVAIYIVTPEQDARQVSHRTCSVRHIVLTVNFQRRILQESQMPLTSSVNPLLSATYNCVRYLQADIRIQFMTQESDAVHEVLAFFGVGTRTFAFVCMLVANIEGRWKYTARNRQLDTDVYRVGPHEAKINISLGDMIHYFGRLFSIQLQYDPSTWSTSFEQVRGVLKSMRTVWPTLQTLVVDNDDGIISAWRIIVRFFLELVYDPTITFRPLTGLAAGILLYASVAEIRDEWLTLLAPDLLLPPNHPLQKLKAYG
jgi:hypothetical protein